MHSSSSLSLAVAWIAGAVSSALAPVLRRADNHLRFLEICLLRSNAEDDGLSGAGGLRVAQIWVHFAAAAAAAAGAAGSASTISRAARHPVKISEIWGRR